MAREIEEDDSILHDQTYQQYQSHERRDVERSAGDQQQTDCPDK